VPSEIIDVRQLGLWYWCDGGGGRARIAV